MEPENEKLFDALGFQWDRKIVPTCVPAHSMARACFRFHKELPQFVWESGVLEGNPLTFTEVQTLLEGVTVGGRKVADQGQILNLAEGSRFLLAMVKAGRFTLSRAVFSQLHGILAHNEALDWGMFRGEGQETHLTPSMVLGTHGLHSPLPTLPGAPELHRVFCRGVAVLEACPPLERAMAFFLFAALQQFFFAGNGRTARFMMNGLLMAHGIDAISIPASKVQTFHDAMVRFYLHKEATAMMAFLVGCHPDLAAFLPP
jgi:Fic family protein